MLGPSLYSRSSWPSVVSGAMDINTEHCCKRTRHHHGPGCQSALSTPLHLFICVSLHRTRTILTVSFPYRTLLLLNVVVSDCLVPYCPVCPDHTHSLLRVQEMQLAPRTTLRRWMWATHHLINNFLSTCLSTKIPADPSNHWKYSDFFVINNLYPLREYTF